MPEGYLADGGDSPLARKIRQLLGATDDEPIVAVTPQFTRTYGGGVYWTPKSAEELDKVKEAPESLLWDMGLRKFSEDGGLWLYPGEWFDAIPEGYEVTDINGYVERFCKATEDSDIRFGCLAFGFIK